MGGVSMTDLISRSAVLEMINRTKAAAMSDEAEFTKSQRKAIRAIADLFLSVVKDISAVDAVPVVRCKDCKWWGDDDHLSTDEIKYCQFGRYMVGKNGYCVYAARMDGESEEEG